MPRTGTIERFRFGFWVTPGNTEVLFLSLSSEITPGMLGAPYEIPGIQPRLVLYKANALPALLSLWPHTRAFTEGSVI